MGLAAQGAAVPQSRVCAATTMVVAAALHWVAVQLEDAFKGTDGQVVIRKHITGIHTELFAMFRERDGGNKVFGEGRKIII